MKNKYQQIQAYIHTTPEMKERLLCSVNEESKNKGKKVPIYFRHNIQRFAAVAACLTIIICGMHFFPRLLNNSGQQSSILNRIQEEIDFDLYTPSVFLNKYELSDYSVSETAVNINYKDGNTEIDYSMSKRFLGLDSVELPDSNLTQYGMTKYVTTTDKIIILYGDDSKYQYVEWYYDGYDFTLTFSNPLSEKDIISIIESVTRYK